MTARPRPALDEWLGRSADVLVEADSGDHLHLDATFITLRRQRGLELQIRRGTLVDEEMVEIAQWDPLAQEFVGSVVIRTQDLQPLIAALRKLGRFIGHRTDPFWAR